MTTTKVIRLEAPRRVDLLALVRERVQSAWRSMMTAWQLVRFLNNEDPEQW